jgi:hypothetical protein
MKQAWYVNMKKETFYDPFHEDIKYIWLKDTRKSFFFHHKNGKNTKLEILNVLEKIDDRKMT